MSQMSEFHEFCAGQEHVEQKICRGAAELCLHFFWFPLYLGIAAMYNIRLTRTEFHEFSRVLAAVFIYGRDSRSNSLVLSSYFGISMWRGCSRMSFGGCGFDTPEDRHIAMTLG
jgi:hypothetical protein